MARYIDADLFVEWQDNRQDDDLYMGWDYVKQCIYDDYVKADVAPIIHAHWEIIYESSAGVTDARCSNCGYESLAYENDVHTDENCNYCPCCGAKMDEEVK